jgi:hypothetical protein
MNLLALIGAALAACAIPVFLVGLLAKVAVLRLYFPDSSWSELTPRRAMQRRREGIGAALSSLAYLYALSQRLGAGLFFSGLVLFLAGYLPGRFGS